MIPMLARTQRGLAVARPTLTPPVVLVPTMGALHEGHRALLRRANALTFGTGSVVVSVFVNPLQFGAGEDLNRYPRTLKRDLAVCAEEGADLVFAPSAKEMYPAHLMVSVDPGKLGEVLEGAFRPGFFGGVLTVVLKVFNLVRPDVAVFGEKDAQQLALVKAMVADLNIPVEIAAVPTVRESSGLAISSRNAYLSDAQRVTALALSKALRAGAAAAPCGPAAIRAAAQTVLDAAATSDPRLAIEYLALADPATFTDVPQDYAGPALLLVAARVGTTRLIDNVPLRVGGEGASS